MNFVIVGVSESMLSKLVPLTPELARTLNMFIRLQVMLFRQSENHFRFTDLLDNYEGS